MGNNKQSSVEWLFEQIARRQGSILQTIPFYDDNQDLLQQAKAMHKEESINLTKHWYNQWEQGKGMTISEYYDQEFNNK